MRRFITLFFLIFTLSGVAVAQQMSDDQVVQYVKDAQKMGKTQKQITTELMRRGVTKEQVERIQEKYENGSGSTGTQNNQNSTRSRMRTQQNDESDYSNRSQKNLKDQKNQKNQKNIKGLRQSNNQKNKRGMGDENLEMTDEDMMNELIEIKANVSVDQTILVVDSMTGQDAVNVASSFNEKVGIDGVILTKLDGDTRGGAALSIKAVTGKPILYVGMGEKLSDLEQFYPDRMASRILGMGDVLTLIEKAEAQLDADKAKAMEEKLKKAEFDFNDFLEYMGQIKNMGGISSIMSMMPGLSGQMKNVSIDDDEAEKNMRRTESIIYSMTKAERSNPDILNPSRKNRIARGAGVDIADVNRLVKQFEQMKKMMKQMPGMMKGAKKGRFKLPF